MCEHSLGHPHASLRVMFAPNITALALIWYKYHTNCDTHPAEINFIQPSEVCCGKRQVLHP